jgi:hypothetical protein
MRSVALSRFAAVVFAATILASCEGESLVPTGSLDSAALVLVDSLIVDEARMVDRYHRIVLRFGDVAPFSALVDAVGSRGAVLRAIGASRPGWVAPDPFAGLIGVEVYRDLEGACSVAGDFARLMVARYDRLLARSLPVSSAAAVRGNRDDIVNRDLSRTASCT